MKFDVNDIRRIISGSKKPKRNVVHTIGYNKFSPQEMFRKTKLFFNNHVDPSKIKKLLKPLKKIFKK